jgi:hypothetical protein
MNEKMWWVERSAYRIFSVPVEIVATSTVCMPLWFLAYIFLKEWGWSFIVILCAGSVVVVLGVLSILRYFKVLSYPAWSVRLSFFYWVAIFLLKVGTAELVLLIKVEAVFVWGSMVLLAIFVLIVVLNESARRKTHHKKLGQVVRYQGRRVVATTFIRE